MNLEEIIKGGGYLLIFAIIFAESGLLIGFFLPGDSLLFTAGFIASQSVNGTPILSLPILAIVCFVAAVSGDSVGYAFGRRVGRRLFERDDSFLFRKKNIERAQAFYEKHGGITIILARFTPIVRTFAPIVAGIGDMHYQRFLMFNVVGGALWSIGLTVAGYVLGKAIPDVDKYLLPIIVLIILVSLTPSILHVVRDEEMRTGIANMVKGLFNRNKTAPTATTEEK